MLWYQTAMTRHARDTRSETCSGALARWLETNRGSGRPRHDELICATRDPGTPRMGRRALSQRPWQVQRAREFTFHSDTNPLGMMRYRQPWH